MEGETVGERGDGRGGRPAEAQRAVGVVLEHRDAVTHRPPRRARAGASAASVVPLRVLELRHQVDERRAGARGRRPRAARSGGRRRRRGAPRRWPRRRRTPAAPRGSSGFSTSTVSPGSSSTRATRSMPCWLPLTTITLSALAADAPGAEACRHPLSQRQEALGDAVLQRGARALAAAPPRRPALSSRAGKSSGAGRPPAKDSTSGRSATLRISADRRGRHAPHPPCASRMFIGAVSFLGRRRGSLPSRSRGRWWCGSG